MTPQPGKIILLNGASSSGKSTLAVALQNAIPQPFWHFSIDHLVASNCLPRKRIRAGDFEWSNLRPAFFEGFHRCLPALAGAGNNLIVEHIVESREWMDRLLLGLEGLDVYFVGLHCHLGELERRERDRGDRCIGEARNDFETTHQFCVYDLELDSTAPVGSNVDALLSAWQERESPSAFERERARLGLAAL